MSFLEIKGVNKRFGGLQALDDVNLNVEEGTIHAIIGPNGAGKSTLLNCFIGKLLPDSGTVTFDGQSLLGLKPWQINQAGVSRVFQTPEIFSDLTVMENVMIPCFARRDGMFRLNGITPTQSETDIRDKAEQMLIDVRMQDKLRMQAGSLSRGDKRRLEMAMCLSQDPKLLLLDEWLAGLNPTELQEGIELIRSLREEGVTIILVEHVMDAIRSLCDRCIVMAAGSKIAEGAPNEVLADPEVVKVYIGEDV